jgi:UDPglucose 6-dehydrogenase
MDICIIGTGYVGLVTGACLAEMGNTVICCDRDVARIEGLKAGVLPFFEPGLEEVVESNVQESRLHFSTDLAEAVRRSTICFIAVGTPTTGEGEADLSAVFEVAEQIARGMDGYRIIATKSTVPVGTGARLAQLVSSLTEHPFSIVANPEFLKQGDAVNDFLKPDRVVIGTSDQRARDEMRELYSPFMRTGNRIVEMDVASAEMTKYAANAFLATKISFINEMSQLCEKVGADIDLVRAGISRDPRIGGHFLFPGVGFGGSCLPKDVRALLRTARESDCELSVVRGALSANQQQREFFWRKLHDHYAGQLSGKVFALWGLSFKPRTDDMRDAPSLEIVERLLQAGATVRAFDPKAMENARRRFGKRLQLQSDAYEACQGADALVILTEWNEFRRPNFERLRGLLRQTVIFDGRNLYELPMMSQRGFTYHSIGRASVGPPGQS